MMAMRKLLEWKKGIVLVNTYHDDGIGMVESPKKVQTETEKLDRDIRIWSSDKEIGIRLLLSTHIIFCRLRVAGLQFLIRAKHYQLTSEGV